VPDTSPYILAKQELAPTAVETVTAQFRVVSGNAVPDLEVLDFGTNTDDHADGFMTGNQWELGNELALVDMLCCSS
jgi:hypothetical protein